MAGPVIVRLLLCLLILLPGAARADEFKPAYLQLTEKPGATYDVLWKVPALDEATPLSLKPAFPPGTQVISPPRGEFFNSTSTVRYRIAVPGGLAGKPIGFEGLAKTRIEILVRFARLDGSEQVARPSQLAPSFTASAAPARGEVVISYTRLGIEHILGGFDHLLFVAALVMLIQGRRKLILAITAFTLAHSTTLALATFKLVAVPGPPVEAAIALSIVFVAAEIIRREHGQESLATSQPWLVAFTFGLLHGLGFAGALAEIGLPPDNIPLALLFFNVGVEIGQLAFVIMLLGLAWLARRALRPAMRPTTVMVPAYAIGGLAGYWTIDRLLSLGAG